MNRFRTFACKASHNHTRTVWVLKCDIKRFFANIDHEVLFSILAQYIPDGDVLGLLKNIVGSFPPPLQFSPSKEGERRKGLPLGNLTSQLLVNVYMNEFDQFVKRELRVRHYLRYADDFVVLHERKEYLPGLLRKLSEFLETKLKLSLHPDKVFIKTVASGLDFLGWVHFPDLRVLRTTTKRRMFRQLTEENEGSYRGLCKHGNAFKLTECLETRLHTSTSTRTSISPPMTTTAKRR